MVMGLHREIRYQTLSTPGCMNRSSTPKPGSKSMTCLAPETPCVNSGIKLTHIQR